MAVHDGEFGPLYRYKLAAVVSSLSCSHQNYCCLPQFEELLCILDKTIFMGAKVHRITNK